MFFHFYVFYLESYWLSDFKNLVAKFFLILWRTLLAFYWN